MFLIEFRKEVTNLKNKNFELRIHSIKVSSKSEEGEELFFGYIFLTVFRLSMEYLEELLSLLRCFCSDIGYYSVLVIFDNFSFEGRETMGADKNNVSLVWK